MDHRKLKVLGWKAGARVGPDCGWMRFLLVLEAKESELTLYVLDVKSDLID